VGGEAVSDVCVSLLYVDILCVCARGEAVRDPCDVPWGIDTLLSAANPYTLHPAHCTLRPSPYAPHPTPYTLHPTPYTLPATPYTLHPILSPLTPPPQPQDIDKRLAAWVKAKFQDAPDLQQKIKISSDRCLHFQLVGSRVRADTPATMVQLLPFVTDDGARALLGAAGGYQAKVARAGSGLWSALEAKVAAVRGSEVHAARFAGADYSNKDDAEFQEAKALLADINVLYDAVKLFKLHVLPHFADQSAVPHMDLQSLSDALSTRVEQLAQQIAGLQVSQLDEIAGLLMTMHMQSEELLFQVGPTSLLSFTCVLCLLSLPQEDGRSRRWLPYTLHPKPCTLHPTPCTLHPTPYSLHPTPYTLHPTPYTHALNPQRSTLHATRTP